MENNQNSTAKTKTCPVCKSTFECLHSAKCWCVDYNISKENSGILQEKYGDCLCPNCLNRYTESD